MPTSSATAAKGSRAALPGGSGTGLQAEADAGSRANRFRYATRPSTIAVRPSSVSS